jgi:hypothetical protein
VSGRVAMDKAREAVTGAAIGATGEEGPLALDGEQTGQGASQRAAHALPEPALNGQANPVESSASGDGDGAGVADDDSADDGDDGEGSSDGRSGDGRDGGGRDGGAAAQMDFGEPPAGLSKNALKKWRRDMKWEAEVRTNRPRQAPPCRTHARSVLERMPSPCTHAHSHRLSVRGTLRPLTRALAVVKKSCLHARVAHARVRARVHLSTHTTPLFISSTQCTNSDRVSLPSRRTHTCSLSHTHTTSRYHSSHAGSDEAGEAKDEATREKRSEEAEERGG